jgi:hypothetical protein
VGSGASDTDTHVIVEGNSTFANAGLGIDLAPKAVVNCTTPPPGPNGYTPCPVIATASTAAVTGVACAGCTVEVFVAQPGSGDGGHGEGATLLVRTLAGGNGSWTVAIPAGTLSAGDQVTATATTPPSTVPSQTSEFGANTTVS